MPRYRPLNVEKRRQLEMSIKAEVRNLFTDLRRHLVS